MKGKAKKEGGREGTGDKSGTKVAEMKAIKKTKVIDGTKGGGA